MAIPLSGVDPTTVITSVGLIVTWILILGRWQRAGGRHDAVNAEAIRELTAATDRLTKVVEKTNEWTRTHERDCDKRWAKADEASERRDQQMTDTNRTLENIQRQVTNIALGIAPTPAVELPGQRRERR